MYILARLGKKGYKVYKLLILKELKQSTSVALKEVDTTGAEIGDFVKYNMPSIDRENGTVEIKYKSMNDNSRFSYWTRNMTEFSWVKEECKLVETFEQTTELFFIKRRNDRKRHIERINSYIASSEQKVVQNSARISELSDKVRDIQKAIADLEESSASNSQYVEDASKKIKRLIEDYATDYQTEELKKLYDIYNK